MLYVIRMVAQILILHKTFMTNVPLCHCTFFTSRHCTIIRIIYDNSSMHDSDKHASFDQFIIIAINVSSIRDSTKKKHTTTSFEIRLLIESKGI